jgi:hypothetical protein
MTHLTLKQAHTLATQRSSDLHGVDQFMSQDFLAIANAIERAMKREEMIMEVIEEAEARVRSESTNRPAT